MYMHTCACVVLWIPFPRRCYTSAMRHFLLFFSRFHFNLIEKKNKKKWKPRSAIPSCLFCHFQAKSLYICPERWDLGWFLTGTLVQVCIWNPWKNERSISHTQTLHFQYLYTLNLHLMKVLSLLFFAERLYKASNIFM